MARCSWSRSPRLSWVFNAIPPADCERKVYRAEDPKANPLLLETLKAHFRARQEDLEERLTAVPRPYSLRWTRDFPNGAGDLANRPAFVIADPDLADLEKLFSAPDPRSEQNETGPEGGLREG
jgi:hypothetical protein